MKNKYQRLSSDEKKQARLDYRDSNEINGNIYKKLNRLTIISTIGIVYSILSFVIDLFLTKIVWDFVIDAVLLIFCLIFIIKSQSLLSEQVNKFLINRENNKKDNNKSKNKKK